MLLSCVSKCQESFFCAILKSSQKVDLSIPGSPLYCRRQRVRVVGMPDVKSGGQVTGSGPALTT